MYHWDYEKNHESDQSFDHEFEPRHSKRLRVEKIGNDL